MDERQKKSLETGSGITWEEWLRILEPHQELDHTAMAAVVLERILAAGASKSPEWWAQGVTVAYEQHIGRRKVGQRCDGLYSATVSKVMAAEMDDVLRALEVYTTGIAQVAGVPVEGESRSSQSEKWRYWKIDLADGSRVSINIQTKAPGKSSMAVNHDKIPTEESVAQTKAWWKAFLNDFYATLT